MNLQSMTGFARAWRDHAAAAITWELRSVNGKGLDARVRLPPGFERLEQPAKQAIQKRFSRGNIQAALTLSYGGSHRQPVVNQALLGELAGLAKRLEVEHGAAPATADGLLGLRGVLEMPDPAEDEETRGDLDAAVLETLEGALDDLEEARRQEGASLEKLILGHVAAIEELTARAETDPSREPVAIRERIAEQVKLLLDAAPALEESRLHMEAAFLATKADIREEVDRLKTHVASARSLVEAGGPAGRRLDFLAQEFNRESNTLCSKSNAASITAIGLELKTAVDQLREQVQNLE